MSFRRGSGALLAAAFVFCAAAPIPGAWWKGNTHTHTLWSDGDDYPEVVVEWYKMNDYHFLAISDHNILLTSNKWITVTNRNRSATLAKYLERFGTNWVQQRITEGTQQVQLKTLEEFRALFEETNRFLLIPGEEISARFRTQPLHINAINLQEFIAPEAGTNVVDVLQRNVNAVLEQRRRTGVAMFPHINHPNFGWAMTAEDLMQIQGEKFFEVYNGHPAVNNEGDLYRVNTERIWDIVLTHRLAVLDLEPMYGLAVDDAHNYHIMSRSNSNPGRGWIMVRSDALTPDAIIRAMEAGDFYASSGVRLRDVRSTSKQLSINIEPEQGVTYRTQFIGTKVGFDRQSEPGQRPPGTLLPVTRQYSYDIGAVLAEVSGVQPKYNFRDDEIYVRAKVISSKEKSNPYHPGELESAWTQPVVPSLLSKERAPSSR